MFDLGVISFPNTFIVLINFLLYVNSSILVDSSEIVTSNVFIVEQPKLSISIGHKKTP